MDRDVEYWWRESNESLETAEVLLKSGRYLECAFFCHLAVEKILKALIIDRRGEVPPRTHNLLLLSHISNVDEIFDDKMKDFLADVAPFQIEGRYPVERRKLLQENPPEKFCELYLATKEAVLWLAARLR